MTETPTIIENRYVIQEQLGKGAFAVVYKCFDNRTNYYYAAKVFQKHRMSNRELMKLESEARICQKLIHPNIVRLHKVIRQEKIHIILFDLVTGGELFDDLVTREGNYTEELAAKCMFQLLDTVKYCHKLGVVHRDLKPENILLESVENKIIKLADFGLAVEVEGDEMKRFGIAGTPNYMAPEVFEMKPYGKPVDCWACGVIMYILLAGRQPFCHPDHRKLELLIKTGSYELESQTWQNVTTESKDLIMKLLCVVPTRRLTADEALQHPWFLKIKSSTSPFKHHSDTFEALKEFNARRKIKVAIKASIFISKVSCLITARRRVRRSTGQALNTRSSVVTVQGETASRKSVKYTRGKNKNQANNK